MLFTGTHVGRPFSSTQKRFLECNWVRVKFIRKTLSTSNVLKSKWCGIWNFWWHMSPVVMLSLTLCMESHCGVPPCLDRSVWCPSTLREGQLLEGFVTCYTLPTLWLHEDRSDWKAHKESFLKIVIFKNFSPWYQLGIKQWIDLISKNKYSDRFVQKWKITSSC